MKNSRIRLIALDCDGTIFSRHGTLSAYSAEILKKARDEGILIAVCTGRPFYSVEREFPKEFYDYAICRNGQSVYRNDGTLIKEERSLSSDEIRHLIPCLEKYNVMIGCSYEDCFHYFCSKRHHFSVWAFQTLKNMARLLLGRHLWHDDMHSDYQQIYSHTIYKICFSGVHTSLKKIADSLDPSAFSFFFVNPMWLEVQPYGIDKGTGLKTVMDLCEIDADETAAIGDGENDIPMLETAGISVAMKNAMASLKKTAVYITEEDYTEDGAAKWIARHLLQNDGQSAFDEVK